MLEEEKRNKCIKVLEQEIADINGEICRLRKACVNNCNMGLDGYCSEMDIVQTDKLIKKQIKEAMKKRAKLNVLLTRLKG